jgi:hypothetical protein
MFNIVPPSGGRSSLPGSAGSAVEPRRCRMIPRATKFGESLRRVPHGRTSATAALSEALQERPLEKLSGSRSAWPSTLNGALADLEHLIGPAPQPKREQR